MLRVFLACAFCALTVSAQPGQLDASPTLFSVMAALHAAGYDTDFQSPNNHPLRAQVVAQLKGKNLASVAEIKGFLERRGFVGKRLDMNRFVSFAMSVDGPPSFAYKFPPHELPPDVTPLEGFEQIMVRFHKEAGIDELWQKAQPDIEKVLAGYQVSFIQTISTVNGYLRNPTSGYLGRRFQIFVELLAPPNQVQTRAYKDDYNIILTPSPEPRLDYLRYAYLHYLLDPLSFKFAEKLEKKKPLIDLAQAAPALDEHYKNDFPLLVTTCLLKAVDARMRKGEGQKLVDDALAEGFILTPYFYEALAAYEKQEVSMRLYYGDLIDGIDLKKEDRRLLTVKFADAKGVKRVAVAPHEEKAPDLSGVFKTLDDAEELYRARKIGQAKPLFLRALQETPEEPLHAKAYYGLARIAALERDPELSVKLFEKVLDLHPDGQTKAWSHVYLGRLADLANERDNAVAAYNAALAVPGISPAARQAAQSGLADIFKSDKKKEK